MLGEIAVLRSKLKDGGTWIQARTTLITALKLNYGLSE